MGNIFVYYLEINFKKFSFEIKKSFHEFVFVYMI